MIVVSAVLVAALYAAGVRAVARRGTRGWPAWRSAAFALGLVALLGALASPLHARGEEELSAHMVQHLLLTLVAAPLLVLGAPVALALRALRGSARRQLGAVVTSRAARAVAHPATAVVVFSSVTLATHLSGLYDLALRVPLVHELEHVLFLASALLLWTALIGVHPGTQPGPLGRLGWLMAAMPAMSAIGAALAGADHVWYATYLHGTTEAAALADQRDAGGLMWSLGTFPMALAAFGLAMEGLWREERRQRRREALAATPARPEVRA